jgi:hypothetical protein
MRRARVRGLASLVACIVAICLPSSAHAVGGIYDVRACNQAGGVNNSFTYAGDLIDMTPFQAWGACTLWAQNVPNAATPYGVIDTTPAPLSVRGVGFNMQTPSGTYLYNTYLDGRVLQRAPNTQTGQWYTKWTSRTAFTEQIHIGGHGVGNYDWNGAGWFTPPGHANQNISLEAGCIGLNVYCNTNTPYGVPYTYIELRGAIIQVRDMTDPTIDAVSGSMLTSWRRGNQTIYWRGNDATGIKQTVAYIHDGASWQIPAGTSVAHGCNYTYPAPCTQAPYVGYWVNTALYPNGARSLILRAFDASNYAGWGAQEGVTGIWGNWGDHSQTVYFDNAAPNATGNMEDGTGADVEWTTSNTQLSANWAAAADNGGSGVHSYQLCFGTGLSCTGAIWNNNVGNVTSRTATGLSLSQGTRYYACAYTLDNSLDSAGNPGNSSGWACEATGQRVDSVNPAAVTVTDSLGADIAYINATNSLQANWTVSSDATSGLSRYDYCVSTSATGADCGGGATRTWTGNALTTNVTAAGLPALANGTTYYVCVRVRDVAGNVTPAYCSNGQRIDTTPPSTPTLVSPPDNIGIAAWPALTATYIDPAPATPGRLLFQVCSDAACTTVVDSGTSSSTTIATGSNGTWTATAPNGSYWWRARGQDGAGNLSAAWTATRLITVGSSSASINVDAPSRSLGLLTPTVDATATTVVTLSTNAANGYQLQASDPSNSWGLNQPAVASIPDWTGTVAIPTVWAAGTSGYFGVTVRDATGGRLAKWGAGTNWPASDYVNNRYAGLTTSPQVLHQRATYGTAVDSVTVTYRTNVPALQTAGAYSSDVTFTIVAQP